MYLLLFVCSVMFPLNKTTGIACHAALLLSMHHRALGL